MTSKPFLDILGVIPARGGSKGVPRKNIRIVAGKPLIYWSIRAGRASSKLTRLIVSTDDPEIADVARAYGVDVPFLRPVELAQDDSPAVLVAQHALRTIEAQDGRYDLLVWLQPTSPLRTGKDIDDAVTLLVESGADSVVSVYRVQDAHPVRMYRIVDGRLTPYSIEPTDRQRQTLEEVYHRNGVIYACRRDLVMEQSTLIGPDTRPYTMPIEWSVNIDNEIDLLLAGLLLEQYEADSQ